LFGYEIVPDKNGEENPILILSSWDKYAKTRRLLEKVFEVDVMRGKNDRKKTTRNPTKPRVSKYELVLTCTTKGGWSRISGIVNQNSVRDDHLLGVSKFDCGLIAHINFMKINRGIREGKVVAFYRELQQLFLHSVLHECKKI
jgi:hypothetical protein